MMMTVQDMIHEHTGRFLGTIRCVAPHARSFSSTQRNLDVIRGELSHSTGNANAMHVMHASLGSAEKPKAEGCQHGWKR
jgi:hypothetical protein